MKNIKEIIVKGAKYVQKQKILFLVPPNITFENLTDPPKNISTISKNNGKNQFGSLIADIPLGITSLNAYLKKNISILKL
tara:strand:- start:777 stop:1016 length:240 start_codon:yes stop_codon:yes gene_type:complete